MRLCEVNSAGDHQAEQNCKDQFHPHLSGNDILPLEDDYSRQQQAGSIRTADTRVVPKTLQRNLRLEHVAPGFHVSRKEVRSQMFEELNPPNNVESQICSNGHDSRL